MKILHIVQAYHPAIGGSEWLVKNISEQLVNRYGDDVTIFTPAVTKPAYFWKNEGAPLPAGIEEINGVTVRRFKVFAGLRLTRMFFAHIFHRLKLPYHDWARTIQTGPLIFDMTQAIANSGADVVFATAFPFMQMYYALAGAKRGNIPLVLLGSIHTADTWGYKRQMMYNAIRQADAYIALTSFERDHLIERGVNPARIHVIGGGVDFDDYANIDGAKIRRRYGWEDKPVLVFLGRQSKLKRIEILLEAMPLVWHEEARAQLLMAGAETDHTPHLERIIHRFPPHQQKNITIIHNFSEREKANLLAASDVLVHPSGNESFGIVFVEAWASSKPVIGANVEAVASLIEAGTDGLLFEYNSPQSLAQAILRLLRDPSLQRRMGEAGRKKAAANYTWEKVSDQLREVYRQVIEQCGSRL